MHITEDILKLRDFIAQVYRKRRAIFATTQTDNMAARLRRPVFYRFLGLIMSIDSFPQTPHYIGGHADVCCDNII